MQLWCVLQSISYYDFIRSHKALRLHALMHPIVLWFSTNILLFAPCTLTAQRPSIDNTSHSDNWRPATPKHLTLNAALWRINIAYIFNRFYPSSQATFLKTSFRIRNSSFKVSTTKNKTTCSIKLSTLNNNIVGQVFCVHIVSFCVRSKRKVFFLVGCGL